MRQREKKISDTTWYSYAMLGFAAICFLGLVFQIVNFFYDLYLILFNSI